MKQIHFATTNKGKVHTFQKNLAKYEIEVVHVHLELPEPRSYDLQEIAKQKASYAYARIQKPCFAVDAGFYIHSLKGFPRSYVNFALETIGLEGILKLVENKSRECEFRSCLAYLDAESSEPKCFEYSVSGVIVDAVRGETKDYQWSELWKIFMPDGQKLTLAEMTLEEYNNWRTNRLDNFSFVKKFAEWYLNK